MASIDGRQAAASGSTSVTCLLRSRPRGSDTGRWAAVMRVRDVMIRATAKTITAPATSVRGVIGSARTNAPSATATIGLTYAYVAINGSGATRSSHTYAVNAIRLPTSV